MFTSPIFSSIFFLFIFFNHQPSHLSSFFDPVSLSLLGVPMQAKFMKYFSYGLPAVIFLVTFTMPANLTIYWFVNNNITVLCHFLCTRPKIKSFLRIPNEPKPESMGMDPMKMMSFNEGRLKRKSLGKVVVLREARCTDFTRKWKLSSR